MTPIINPVDQGQIVEVAWIPLGPEGCLRRETDQSYASGHPDRVTWCLHRWMGGCPEIGDRVVPGEHVWRRGRRVTAREADLLLADAAEVGIR